MVVVVMNQPANIDSDLNNYLDLTAFCKNYNVVLDELRKAMAYLYYEVVKIVEQIV